MLRVGLTGGLGSGKSTVARLLVARGAVLVDADVLAREALADHSPGAKAVIEEFGPGVALAPGVVDRAALGRRVFGDEDARRALESIVHPRVRQRAQELEDAAAAADPGAVVVHDIPLLVETGQAGPGSRYAPVVVVDADQDVRVRRLRARGMEEADARARMAAQAGRETRLAVAGVVLDNNGTEEQLAQQVDDLWDRLVAAEAAGGWR